MKLAPVSADLLIKLAMFAAVVGGAVWAARRAAAAVPNVGDLAGRAWDTATDAAYGVAPWNPSNVFAQGANASVSAAVGHEETLGGWLYDLTHPDPMAEPAPPTAWETSARWNNPSAYVAPSGQGGAAFGIYPRP